MTFVSNMLTITHSTRKMIIFEPEDIELNDDPNQMVFSEHRAADDSYILLEDKQTKVELALPDMEPVFDAVVEALEQVIEPVKHVWSSVVSQVVSLLMPMQVFTA